MIQLEVSLIHILTLIHSEDDPICTKIDLMLIHDRQTLLWSVENKNVKIRIKTQNRIRMLHVGDFICRQLEYV